MINKANLALRQEREHYGLTHAEIVALGVTPPECCGEPMVWDGPNCWLWKCSRERRERSQANAYRYKLIRQYMAHGCIHSEARDLAWEDAPHFEYGEHA